MVASMTACCERCPDAGISGTGHLARRRLLKAALFEQPEEHEAGSSAAAGSTRPTGPGRPAGEVAKAASGPADAQLPRAVTGQIIDISPHFIALGDASGEQRFALTASARAWYGKTLTPAAVRRGDEAVLRLRPGRARVADRIWVGIGRATGTIVGLEPGVIHVDQGVSRGVRTVLIPPRAEALIRVKCANIRIGYLIDLIGIRRPGYLEAVAPAGYQPSYPALEVPVPAPHPGRTPAAISGAATWHDPLDEPHGQLGVRYPAVDPDCGCAEATSEAAATGAAGAFRHLPFLAVGSMLAVRNDCHGLSRALPVIGCAPLTRKFSDRCVDCARPTERGRIAELTLASFIALGGELDQGCFNATITIGR